MVVHRSSIYSCGWPGLQFSKRDSDLGRCCVTPQAVQAGRLDMSDNSTSFEGRIRQRSGVEFPWTLSFFYLFFFIPPLTTFFFIYISPPSRLIITERHAAAPPSDRPTGRLACHSTWRQYLDRELWGPCCRQRLPFKQLLPRRDSFGAGASQARPARARHLPFHVTHTITHTHIKLDWIKKRVISW